MLMEHAYLKLEIFVPEEAFPAVRDALWSVDAGHIGKYDHCLSYSRVTGNWRPLPGTNPYSGEENSLSEEPELKLEVTILKDALHRTMAAVKAAHPYEEPVINVIPLYGVGI